MSGGTPLDGALRAALDRVAASPSVLVALDFDGVLAPIIDDPEGARPLPASAIAVERLVALDGVEVALVSGRSMESLRAVSTPPSDALLVASHGAEGDGIPSELTDEQQTLLARIGDDVAAVVAAHPGTRLEHKPAGVVLHTRSASRDAASAASRAVLEGAATLPEVQHREGKEVVELSVVEADKGSAVVALRDRIAQEGGGERPVVLFVGDDVTDEDAFRALDAASGDLGVKVGPGETAAEFRVDAPDDVSAVLQHLVSALTAAGR